MKCECGHKLKINRKKLILYLLLGKNKTYTKCNQCQKTHCIKILHHIVKDNADTHLKKKNNVRIKKEWREP